MKRLHTCMSSAGIWPFPLVNPRRLTHERAALVQMEKEGKGNGDNVDEVGINDLWTVICTR